MDFGVLSLLPSLIAIGLAIKTKNVIFSLFCGCLTGVLLLCHGNPFLASKALIGDYFFKQVMDSYNAGNIVLILFIGGFIKLLENGGGAQSFAKYVHKVVDTPLKAQLGCWLGGVVIFFTDLGTALLVGPVFRPLFDKLKLSREKLAWVLDSTSSPVAVLIPFIGWGVYIMGLVEAQFKNLQVNASDYETFMQAIPFQIYTILAVIMIPLIAITKKDFAAMKAAEDAMANKPIPEEMEDNYVAPVDEDGYSLGNSNPFMLILPILAVFATLIIDLSPLGFPFAKIPGNAFRVALTTGYFLAGVLLMVMIYCFKVKKPKETFSIYVKGMVNMTEVAIILLLAWSLSAMISKLGTAKYIIAILQSINFTPILIPACIFLFGAVISFSTGSSWGTFAMLMPLAIPMGHAFGISYAICLGAVLSGGLFGDHCSPLSDTTILSSMGAECNLVDHVRTQLPYASINGVLAFIGFIIAGITGSAISTAIAVGLLLVVIFGWNYYDRKHVG